MARLASQSQGGYYATPPEEMDLILKRLVPDNNLNVLDPCCGEGLAIKQIADYFEPDGIATQTYGVELEETRANAARRILTKVVKGGYETLRASNEVFNFLWLNPPYDFSKSGSRMEAVFLRDLTAPNKYLQVGGLLGFCIPQYVLEDCAQILANRFENLTVYRFTDKNYPVFKQIVVFGYRARGRRDPEKVRIDKEKLEEITNKNPKDVPTLAEADGTTFNIPEAKGEVKLFRGSLLDPIEIAIDIEKSSAWNDFENLLLPSNLREDVSIKRPVLPLKPSHMGVAIAAGAVGGNMTNHILVGLTAKKTENTSQFEEDGNVSKTRNIQTERYVTKIRIFSQQEDAKGVFTLE